VLTFAGAAFLPSCLTSFFTAAGSFFTAPFSGLMAGLDAGAGPGLAGVAAGSALTCAWSSQH
jgi:hypothetical protein